MNEICDGCGRPHAAGDAFCPACGRALQETAPAALPPGWVRAGVEVEPDPGDPAFVPLVLDEAGGAHGAAAPVAVLAGAERVGWEPEVLHGTDADDAPEPVDGGPAEVVALPGGAQPAGAPGDKASDRGVPAAGTVPLRGGRLGMPARADVGDLPGGPGWRIRVREATEAMLSGAPLSPTVEPAVAAPTRRAPTWVYPVLVTLILLTSAAAVALLALHAVQRR